MSREIAAVREAVPCGGSPEAGCPERPILELAMPSGLSKRTRWAACPAHLYALLATVDGDEVVVNWLGKEKS